MKTTISLSAGDKLKNADKEERIIHVDNIYVVTVDLNTTRLIFNRYKPDDLIALIINKSIDVVSNENNAVVDLSAVPDKYKEIYEKNKKIVNGFALAFGPYYERYKKKDNNLVDTAKTFDLALSNYIRVIREYYQSGCADISLYSKRTPGIYENSKRDFKKRTGRPPKYNKNNVIIDSKVKLEFEEALSNLLKGDRWISIMNAYDGIIQKHYTKQVIENGVLSLIEEDNENIPTYKQFYNFVKNNTSKSQFDLIKTSAREVRNDKRLLLSDTQYGVYGPGDLVEIDACEVDLSLVDIYNTDNTVARPILYCMIDVATRMILAISVAFENNSILGVTNLFLNLSDDKVEYCKKFGITLEPGLWKSNIIPRRVRFDRGAECRSDQLENIFNKLRIERELVTGGTGSLKGNVEQSFHQMHLAQNYLLENKGLIEKRYDSNHHKEACLTIEEYTKIAINFVLSHNQMVIKNYKSTKDMIINGVPAIPVKLWDYFASKTGLPRQITTANVNQFRFDLMQEYKAKISREGISFIGGHLYINEDDDELLKLMYEAGDNKKDFPIRYDPRNINYIYYLRDNKLTAAKLNQKKSVNDGFENLTFIEMKNLDLRNKQIQNGALANTGKIRRSRNSANEAIIDTALLNRGDRVPNARNLRENRENAKQDYRYANSISTRLKLESDLKTIEKETPIKAITKPKKLEDYKDRNYSDLSEEEKKEYGRLLNDWIEEL